MNIWVQLLYAEADTVYSEANNNLVTQLYLQYFYMLTCPLSVASSVSASEAAGFPNLAQPCLFFMLICEAAHCLLLKESGRAVMRQFIITAEIRTSEGRV